ncbi:MAG: hypothetical protein JST48_04310 [Bacteroidetes bacterium]|nr:hypothetical protein [Bacteroidota bacterium]
MNKLLVLIGFFLTLNAFAQTGSEIYLFDLRIRKENVSISGGKNITNHPGYDNQPFFHFDEPIIYYAAFDENNRSDIKYFNYKTEKTTQLTQTTEREYSPTLTLDEQYVSCIIQRDNNAQDLGKYPVEGGLPTVIISSLMVGYHVWTDNSHVALFVLDPNGQQNELHYFLLPTQSDTLLATNIGRSLHKVPDEPAFSFVHKISEKEWVIKKFNTITKKISTVATTLPGNEDLCWTPDGKLLVSGGAKIFWLNPKEDVVWREVEIDLPAPLKGFSRLAVNSSGNKLALVVAE